ncbi:MAG: 50S ribosomal protein L32e [Candidatus Brockarchaeota archaeon]|nr:50S ribosomal protein L32e [Candidatus Brockarchaeota archaeon]
MGEREPGPRSRSRTRVRRKRKPKFARVESWRYKRLDEAWRAPRGIDSKTRIGRKGWPKKPSVGYGTDKRTRGLHPSGRREALVASVKDVEKLKGLDVVGRISAGVGRKTKREITDKAKELGIALLNPLRERALEAGAG